MITMILVTCNYGTAFTVKVQLWYVILVGLTTCHLLRYRKKISYGYR
jgi:hypothetical protein